MTDAMFWPDPTLPWPCPECGVATLGGTWEEREVYCDDCGSHDGRQCPACGEVQDHVHGAEKIWRLMEAE